MNPKPARSMSWTPEDRVRHKAIRERFQKERPTQEQLLESGEYVGPFKRDVYFALMTALSELKKTREAAGLSLADVAARSGIDKAALSRLENGVHDNPTVDTLMRYAAAVGKRLVWGLQDLTQGA